MQKSYQTYKEARIALLAQHPSGQIKRTACRMWLGNGMGYSPATYTLVNALGVPLGQLWSQNDGDAWHITAA